VGRAIAPSSKLTVFQGDVADERKQFDLPVQEN
jgi:hypothetical protein